MDTINDNMTNKEYQKLLDKLFSLEMAKSAGLEYDKKRLAELKKIVQE